MDDIIISALKNISKELVEKQEFLQGMYEECETQKEFELLNNHINDLSFLYAQIMDVSYYLEVRYTGNLTAPCGDFPAKII